MPFLAHAGKESEEGEGGGRDGDGGEEAFKNSELDGSFGDTHINPSPDGSARRARAWRFETSNKARQAGRV